MDTEGEVFGHLAAFNRLDTNHFQGMTKGNKLGVIIQFAAKGQSPGPGKNRGNGIG